MSGMPMISNDLRSSCRALLLQSYGKENGKFDSVYHDILDNHIPAFTFDLGGGFTWVIGVWLSDVGNRIGGGEYRVYDNGVYNAYGALNTSTGTTMQLNNFSRQIYRIGIIYKYNEPQYATIINQIASANDWYNSWSIDIDKEQGSYRTVLYKSQGDYKIEGLSNAGYTRFEPNLWYNGGYIYAFDLSFKSRQHFDLTVSSQRYSAYSDDPYSVPVVQKSGEREVITRSFDFDDSYLYPFPHIYGGYSDLDNGAWFDVMQELSYAVLEKAGAETEPLIILKSTD